MYKILKPLSLCLLLIMSSSTFAQDTIEVGLKEIAEEFKAVGLAVVVVKDNKPIYKKAIGLQDIEHNIPLSTKHLFRIASISKSFSATAIMQLVEQGKVSLDDDFGKLVGFPIRNPKYPDQVITLRMVLSHTSSINDSNGYFKLDVINPAKNPDWAKSYNDYRPGEGYEYCNLNFNMVGSVLEQKTGVRIDNYIHQQILAPLGLTGGYCVDSLDKASFAKLYSYDSVSASFSEQPAAYNPRSEDIKNYVLGVSTPIFSPTGGMKISPEDLATYMMMHMNYGKYANGRILTSESSKTMQTKLSDPEGYGLALRETDTLIPGQHLIGHTGSAYGLYSAMFFDPKTNYGFVVVTNGCVPIYENGYVALSARTINYLYQTLIK
ncbi:MAG: serine hydrolase domain-containing protein [Sphingobacterium sp.]|uniref:serine hydrolase domain-containing protein n=1 Tax=Sphingobacterium sp. JB170 TaxID=1434842 RepID=UPI00097F13EA|nr:serine hydrolase domain-containing protein [Sphingobacterium sp. JB170]SJN48627.1 Beta-lactamase class C and other penicillin binding proteins [Sphingobacterium sp. JB170]